MIYLFGNLPYVEKEEKEGGGGGSGGGGVSLELYTREARFLTRFFRPCRDTINFGGGLASLAGVLYRVLGFASARTLRVHFFCPGKPHKQLSFTSENRA